MPLAIPLDFILIWYLKDMFNRFHIITEIFWFTGKDVFCNKQRYNLASFIKDFGIINIFKLIRNLFILANLLIKA